MQAITFLVQTLIGLYQVVLLLRLLMQWTRADFRNPIGKAILQVTDPVILPLRKLLPPVGKVDSATVVAIVLVAALKIAVIFALVGNSLPALLPLLRGVVVDVLRLVLQVYLFAVILYALLSFVAPGHYSPAQSLLSSICEPVMRPIRQRIPPLGGLDLTPLWICIALQTLLILIH